MIITAKYASVCPVCRQRIQVGSRVRWSKGSQAQHTACAGASGSRSTSLRPDSLRWLLPRHGTPLHRGRPVSRLPVVLPKIFHGLNR